jgi:multiple sugar transport system ATP-binding protein
MNDGRIHQVGTPDELYDAPVNKFVASFIGTPAMGFLTCRIEHSHGKVGLVSDSARMRLSEQQSRALHRAGSETMTVGIRPERLTLASGEETDADVVIHGTVEVVEMLGAEQYVHFVADGGSLTARVPRDQPVKVDQRVTFTSRNHHLHMFDHETGLALSHRAEQERVS